MYPTQNLNDATRLYEVLGKYVPSVPNEEYLDYVNTILENIKQSGNYYAYIDAVQIMTGTDRDELLKQSPEDVLVTFMKELSEWHILELVAFFRGIGYKND